MSVAPRWKRRADEIAEAIGDELSINGTVSIGNDVTLSVATITALANAITSVLNPTSIATAIWLQQEEVGTHVATVLAANSSGLVEFQITLNGVFVLQRSHIYNHDLSATVSAAAYATGSVINVILTTGTTDQYRLLNPNAIDHTVSVLSSSTTPVHVQVRNIAGGFTAMGSDISTSMKLTSQPVSVADTVNVKTGTGEAVAVTGSVNLNVGSSTVPISNPNNITVPVVNTNSVTVPVSLGSVTVPIKATTAGIPQNASGVSVYVPVDGNHSVTVPVSGGVTSIPVSGGVTSIPVSGGTTSVPIFGGTSSVPVANTNNITVPIATQTTSIDVNIKTIEASAKTQFHEAVETALNDATDIDIMDKNVGRLHWYNSTTPQTNNSWIINVAGVLTNGQTLFVAGTGTILGSNSFASANVGRPVHKVSGTTWSFSALESGATHGSITSVATQVETAVTNALNNATVAVSDADMVVALESKATVAGFGTQYVILMRDSGTGYNLPKTSFTNWASLTQGDRMFLNPSGNWEAAGNSGV